MEEAKTTYPEKTRILDVENIPVMNPDLLYPSTEYYNPGVERLGKYDTFWKPGINQEAHRSSNQNWAQKWGNGIARSSLSIATKTLAGLGHVGGAIGALGMHDSTMIYDNAFSNYFANLEEGIKEKFPVYKSLTYQKGNLGDKIWTADFWADNFLDGAAFAASAILTSKGIGALGKTGMFSGLTKLAKSAEMQTQLAHMGQLTATTAINTISESGVEARDLYKNLIAQGVPEERAKSAAMETFALNMAVLAVPNALQAKWISGTVEKNFAKLSKLAKGEKGISFSGKDFLKNFGEGVASEGLWEENVQTAIENYETDYAKAVTDEKALAGIGKNMFTNLKGFVNFLNPLATNAPGSEEDNGATSIFLGGLLGGPMSGLSSWKQHLADKKEYDRLVKWRDSVSKFGDDANFALHEDLGNPFKEFYTTEQVTDPETGKVSSVKKKVYKNSKGQVVYDINKKGKTAVHMLSGLENEAQGAYATIKGDNMHHAWNQELAVAATGYRLGTAKHIDPKDIDDVIDLMAPKLEETEKEFGVEDLKKRIKEYYELYRKVDADMATVYELDKDGTSEALISDVKKITYNLERKLRAFKALQKLDANNEFINKSIDEITETLADTYKGKQSIVKQTIDSFKEAARLYEEHKATGEPISEARYKEGRVVAIDGLTELHNSTDSPRDQMNYLNLRQRKAVDSIRTPLVNENLRQLIDDDAPSADIIAYINDNLERVDPDLIEEVYQTFYNKSQEINDSIADKQAELKAIEKTISDRIDTATIEEMDQLNQRAKEIKDEIFPKEQLANKLEAEGDRTVALATDYDKEIRRRKKKNAKRFSRSLERTYFEDIWFAEGMGQIENFRVRKKEYAEQPSQISKSLKLLEVARKVYEKENTAEAKQMLALIDRYTKNIEKAYTTAQKNFNNKFLKNKIHENDKQRWFTTVLSSDGVKEILSEVLTEEVVDNILDEEITDVDGDKYEGPVAPIFILIDKFNKVATVEQKAKLKEALENFVDVNANEFFDELGIKSKPLVRMYKKSPMHTFETEIISKYSLKYKLNLSYNVNSPFYAYNKSKDLGQLEFELSKDTSLEKHHKDRLIKLVNNHIMLLQAKTLLSFATADSTMHEIVDTLQSQPFTITPSIQQFLTTVEALAALLRTPKKPSTEQPNKVTKNIEEEFNVAGLDNLVYVSGPAGSGKTKVVAKSIIDAYLKLTKKNKTTVLAFSDTEGASINVQEALGTTKGNTIGTFLMKAEELMNKHKLIVIDEAAALDPSVMDEFIKTVNTYNEKVAKKDKVSVLTLGDASQIITTDIPAVLGSGYITSPLTISYRTSIGAIENTAAVYKDNPNEVDTVSSFSNVSLSEATSTDAQLTGVMSGKEGSTSETIIKILANRKNDNRKRVILVGSPDQLATYKDVTNAEVVVYKEYNGRQADEVYLDIDKNGKDYAGQPFANRTDLSENMTWLDYNSAMYTSISRAIQFVYVGNPEVSSSASPHSIDATSTEGDVVKEENAQLFAKMIDSIKKMYAKHMGENTFQEPTTPEKIEEENEEFITEEDENPEEPNDISEEEDNGDPKDTTPDLKKNTEPNSKSRFPDKVQKLNGETTILHQLAHINHNNLPGKEDSGAFSAFNVLTRDGYMTIIASEQYDKEEDRVRWRTIANIGNADLEDAFGTFYHHMNDEKGSFTDPGRGFFDLPAHAVPIFKGTITEAQKIKALYNSKNPVKGKGIINAAIVKTINNLFGKTQLVQSPVDKAFIPVNGKVDLSKLNGKIELRMFKAADFEKEGSEFHEDHKRVGFTKNAPYLIIHNLKSTAHNKPVAERLFIKMPNVNFNVNSPDFAPVAEYTQALNRIDAYFKDKYGPSHGFKSSDKEFTALVMAYAAQYTNETIEDPFDIVLTKEQDHTSIIAEAIRLAREEIKYSSKRPYPPITVEDLAAIEKDLDNVIKSLYRGYDRTVTMTKEEFENSEYNTEDYTWQPNTKNENGKVYRYSLRDDESIITTPVMERSIQRRNGKAQIAFDNIARENANIVINGKKKRIRNTVTEDRMAYTAFKKSVRKGLPLLVSLKYNSTLATDAAFRGMYFTAFGVKATGLSIEEMEEALLNDPDSTYSAKEILDTIIATFNPPVGLDVLNNIVTVNEEGYHESIDPEGNKFYLRQPINAYDFNKKGKEISRHLDELESHMTEDGPTGLLQSSFTGFRHTKVEISVTTKANINVEPTVSEAKVLDAKEEIEELVRDVEETGEDIEVIIPKVIELGEELTEEEAEELSKQVPEKLKDVVKQATKAEKKAEESRTSAELTLLIKNRIKKIPPKYRKDIAKEFDLYQAEIQSEPEAEKKQSLLDYLEGLDSFKEINIGSGDMERLGREISIKQAKRQIKKLLPGVPVDDDLVQFLEDEAYFKILGKEDEGSWGVFKKGIIYLRLNSDGKTFENAVAHEVFHRVWQRHLSPEQRGKIKQLAIKQFEEGVKNLTSAELEEFMAQMFEGWRTNRLALAKGSILNLFKRVKRIYSYFVKEPNSVKEFFDSINTGYYDALTFTNSTVRTMQMNVSNKLEYYKEGSIKENKYNPDILEIEGNREIIDDFANRVRKEAFTPSNLDKLKNYLKESGFDKVYSEKEYIEESLQHLYKYSFGAFSDVLERLHIAGIEYELTREEKMDSAYLSRLSRTLETQKENERRSNVYNKNVQYLEDTYGLEIDREYTVEEIDAIIAELDSENKVLPLFRELKDKLKEAGATISFTRAPKGQREGIMGAAGYSKSTKGKGFKFVKIYLDSMLDVTDKEKLASILVHESIHTITQHVIGIVEDIMQFDSGMYASNSKERERLNGLVTTKQKAAVRNLNLILSRLKFDPNFSNEYGITNIHELLAELANPKFAQKLKETTFDEEDSIWDRIISFIMDLFDVRPSAYDLVREQLENIISEPNIGYAWEELGIRNSEQYYAPQQTPLSAFNESIEMYKQATALVKTKFDKILNKTVAEGGGIGGLVASETEALTYIKRNLGRDLRNKQRMVRALDRALASNVSVKEKILARSKRRSLESDIDVLLVLNKVNNFAKLVSNIYPEWMSSKEIEDVTDSSDDYSPEEYLTLFDEDVATQSLREQIASNDQQNRELTLSKTLRHWLSGFTGKDGSLISDRFAYFSMLMLVSKLDLNNLANLKDQLFEYGKRNTIIGPTKSIVERLIKTAELAESTIDTLGRELPKGVTIVSEYDNRTKSTKYYLATTEHVDIDLTRVDLKKEIESDRFLSMNVVLHQVSLDNLAPIYKAAKEARLISDATQFNSIYERHKARDIMRSIQNNFGSVKEMELRILTIDNDFGKRVFRYIQGSYIGQHNSLKAMLETALSMKLVEDNYHTSSEWRTTSALLSKSSVEEKAKGIKSFLKDIGLGEYRNATIKNVAKVASDIEHAMGRAKGVNFREALDGFDPIELFLEDNSSVFSSIALMMMQNGEYMKNPSMKDGSGNSVYKYVNSDFLYNTVNKLIQSQAFKGSKGNNTSIPIPAYLKTKFFKNNAVVQGLIQISQLDYHDTQKYLSSGATVAFTDENTFKAWIQREFVGSFLVGLQEEGFNSGNYTYWQPSYTLSDRGKLPVYKATYHTIEKVKEVLIPLMRKQMEERNPGLDLFFKSYDHKKKINAKLLDLENGLEKEVDKITKMILEEEIALPFDLDKIWRKIMKDAPMPFIVNGKKGFESFEGRDKYKVTKEILRPLVQAYIYNNYVNSYFVNQLYFGDYAYYKDGNDVLKRGAGPSAPGQAPLVDEIYGMPKTSKFAFLNDEAVLTKIPVIDKTTATKEEIAAYNKEVKKGSMERFLERFVDDRDELDRILRYFGKDSKITDAQGVHTPKRAAQYMKGYGKAYGISASVKPVYFNIQSMWTPYIGSNDTKVRFFKSREQATNFAIGNKLEEGYFKVIELRPGEFTVQSLEAVPVYLKYSSVELSNDLVDQFPQLAKVRKYLEDQSVDELIFASAVKVGLPSRIMEADSLFKDDAPDLINTMDLENEGFRMQLNPYHEAAGHVATPTQFLYFLNIENTGVSSNSPEAQAAYKANSYLLEKGLEKFKQRLNKKGVKGIITDALKGGKTTERPYRLAAAGISHNNPALERIASMKLAGEVFKSTIRSIKFPGGKYTLQSSWGITLDNRFSPEVIDASQGLNYYKTTNMVTNEITGKTEEQSFIVAQTIFPRGALPKDIEDKIERGEDVFLQADAFAFRIPTTEIHSGVALKIVGFYDSKGTNVIIAPRELVPLHGSDFDADALFVITRETFKEDIEILGDTLFKKGQFIGYSDVKKDGKDVLALDSEFISVDLDYAYTRLETFLEENPSKLDEYYSLKGKLDDIGNRYALNVISESMLKVVQDPKNIGRTMIPISTERFTGKYGGKSMREILSKLEENPKVVDRRASDNDKDLSSAYGRYISHKSVFDGNSLVGIFANAVKVFAYITNAGISPELNTIADSLVNASTKKSEANELYKTYKVQLKNALIDGNLSKAEAIAEKMEELESINEKIDENIRSVSLSLKDLKKDSKSYYPTVPVSRAFQIDGHIFDSHLERELDFNAKEGDTSYHSVWETLDALINLAIDNTKEQGLYMIGANIKTANALATMIAMGVPLDTSVFMLRQPIVEELGKSKYFDTAASINKILGKLKDAIGINGKTMGPITTKAMSEKVGTYFNLEELLAEYKQVKAGETAKEKARAKELYDEIKYHYDVLRQYRRIFSLGEDIKTISQFLQVLREPPTTIEDVFKLLGSIDTMFEEYNIIDGKIDNLDTFNSDPTTGTIARNSRFGWNIQNLFRNNPHIATSLRVFKLYSDILERYFFVASKQVNSLIHEKGIDKRVKLTTGGDENRTVYHNRMLIAKQLTRYLMSNVYVHQIESEPEFTYYDEKGGEVKVTGAEAIMQSFLNKVVKLQEEDAKLVGANTSYPGNYALQHMTIKGKHDGYKVLSYSGGVNSSPEDQLFAEQQFNDLDEETQQEFLMYSILKSGLNFALTGISNLFSPELLLTNNNEVVEQLDNFRYSPKQQEELIEDFEVQFYAEFADKHKWIPSTKKPLTSKQPDKITLGKRKKGSRTKPVYNSVNYAGTRNMTVTTIDELGVERRSTQRVYYDRIYKNEFQGKDEFESNYPEVIKMNSKFNSVAYIRTSGVFDPFVTYQYLGKKGKGFIPYTGEGIYKKENHFNNRFPTIKVNKYSSISKVTGDVDLNYIPKNQPIAITTKTDVNNSKREWVTLVSSTPVKSLGLNINTHYEYVFKPSEAPDFLYETPIQSEQGEATGDNSVEEIPDEKLTSRQFILKYADEVYLVRERFGEIGGAIYLNDGVIMSTTTGFSSYLGFGIKDVIEELEPEGYIIEKTCK